MNTLKYYIFVGIIAVIAVAVIGLAVSYSPRVSYRYINVSEASKHYICSECHLEPLICSKEIMAHDFLPSSVDHNIHIKAAREFAERDMQNNPRYPSCMSCHSYFTAEKGISPEQSISLCTHCHGKAAFHDQVLSLRIGCISCHSDWTGRNITVKLAFPKIESMCQECHSKSFVKSYSLTEIHELHGRIMDCAKCHKADVNTHRKFFTSIIATPKTTCKNCHNILGLHGTHYEKLTNPSCTLCHGKGIGKTTFMSSIEPLKTCLSCHSLGKTRLHEKITEAMLQKYHCLKCHDEWIDREPAKYGNIMEVCSKCHPLSFTVKRSYGLHKVHLTKAYIKSCSVCHVELRPATHADWISSAENVSICLSCHSLEALRITHGAYFEHTTNCFASGCHSGFMWGWPKPFEYESQGG